MKEDHLHYVIVVCIGVEKIFSQEWGTLLWPSGRYWGSWHVLFSSDQLYFSVQLYWVKQNWCWIRLQLPLGRRRFRYSYAKNICQRWCKSKFHESSHSLLKWFTLWRCYSWLILESYREGSCDVPEILSRSCEFLGRKCHALGHVCPFWDDLLWETSYFEQLPKFFRACCQFLIVSPSTILPSSTGISPSPCLSLPISFVPYALQNPVSGIISV